jgi:hypothetical protein
MKKTVYLLIIFCAFLLASCVSTVPKANTPLASLLGNYTGKVFSGIGLIPVETRFSTDKQGKLTASYTMLEESGAQEGYLDHFVQEGPYTLLATWHDKYGEGKLRMLFTTKLYKFEGFWGLNAQGTLMSWDGSK